MYKTVGLHISQISHFYMWLQPNKSLAHLKTTVDHSLLLNHSLMDYYLPNKAT